MKKSKTERMLSELRPIEMTEDAKQSILENIRNLEKQEPSASSVTFPWSWRAVILKAAAILIAAVGLGVIIVQVSRQSTGDGAPAPGENGKGKELAATAHSSNIAKPAHMSLSDSDTVDPDSLVPASIKTYLLSESDEGIVMTPQGPMRMIKYRLRDDYELQHPYSNARITRSVPREHVVLTSVTSN